MVHNGTFKPYEELTEQERKRSYEIAKLAIADGTKNNFLSASVLSKNVIEISQLAKVDPNELSDITLEMHSLAHQISFGKKKREGIGFKQ